jgi:hypothetical protein
MAYRDFTCSADALVAEHDGYSSLGAGQDDHLPVGFMSTDTSYQVRSLVKFSTNWADMTSITSATLYLKTSNTWHTAVGGTGDRDIYVARCTSSWSEGTRGSDEVWYGDNSVEWSNQPSVTTTGRATIVASSADNTWVTCDVTDIVMAWAPSSLGGSAASNYGVRLYPVSEAVGGDRAEFWSAESGNGTPKIRVYYTTNSAPTAPTGLSPSGSISGTNPTFTLTHNDADSDPLSTYDLQVSTDQTFVTVTHLNAADKTDGITGDTVSVSYSTLGGTALSAGTTYYWRARTNDGVTGDGTWCAAQTLYTNRAPTAAVTTPAATGHLASLVYTAGEGWTAPRLYVAWSMTDADSDTQTKYQLVITECSTSGGTYTSFYDSGEVSSSASSATISTTLTESYYYKVKVKVYDGTDWSAYSSEVICRARWGLSTHVHDLSTAPTAWIVDVLDTTTSSQSEVIVEYGSDTDGDVPAETWQASLSTVTKRRYLHYRVWMLVEGSSPTSPSLNEIKFITTGAGATGVQDWLPATLSTQNASLVTDEFYVGGECLRIDGDGTENSVTQTVNVVPYTDYVLHGFIKTYGHADACIYLDNTYGKTESTVVEATQDWTHIVVAAWNSGAATSVDVGCQVSGASGTYAYFDALKLERGTVASPWSGTTSMAATTDAGGLRINAAQGGSMTLIGSTGGTKDQITIGAHGLVVGGTDTVEVYSDTASTLTIDGKLEVNVTSSGKDQITIPDTTAGAGLTIGADTNLYRSAANTLKTDDALQAASVALGTNKLMRFVTISPESILSSDDGQTSDQTVTPTTLPTDGTVKAVAVLFGIRRNADTNNESMSVKHYGGTAAGITYTSGVISRGGFNWCHYVETGGTNNVQFKWASSDAGSDNDCYLSVYGYWTDS